MTVSHEPEYPITAAVQAPLFRGIEEGEARRLLARPGITALHYAKGALIYGPDTYERSVGYITAGRASVTKGAGDSAMLMSVLHPGELFGAATLFDRNGPYVANIRALAGTWAVMIPESALLSIMQEDFRVAENYMAYLTQRIRFLSGRIDGFAQDGAEERLLLFIRKNAKDSVYTPEGGMRALSEALCMGRTTLYRGLDSLTARGVLEKKGKTIVLLKEDL